MVILSAILFSSTCLAQSNHVPEIYSTAPDEAAVDQKYSYTIEAVDADWDALTFSLDEKPVGMTVHKHFGTIEWTPMDGQEGTARIVANVSDGVAWTTQNIVLTVHPRGADINAPPVIRSDPSEQIVAGKTYSYQIEALDADGDELRYSLLYGPNLMKVDPLTGNVTWVPSEADTGTYRIILRVWDGDDNGTQGFTLRVGAGNHKPMILSTAPAKAEVGSVYKYQIVGADPDTGDELTYGLVDGPTGMMVANSSGTLRWVPKEEQEGKQTFTVCVSDGIDQVNQTVTVDVKGRMTVEKALKEGLPWIGTLIVVILVVLFIGLYLRRRKRIAEAEEKRRAEALAAARAKGPPPPEMSPEEREIIERPVDRPVTHTVKDVVEEALEDLKDVKTRATVEAPTSKVPQDIERPTRYPKKMTPYGNSKKIVTPKGKKKKADKVIEDLLRGGQQSEASDVPKARASPVTHKESRGKKEKSRRPRYPEALIMELLSEVSGDLPKELVGRSRKDLARAIAFGRYAKTKKGEVLINLDKKWYHGDPEDLETYLTRYRKK
jgi:hypothetical protein